MLHPPGPGTESLGNNLLFWSESCKVLVGSGDTGFPPLSTSSLVYLAEGSHVERPEKQMKAEDLSYLADFKGPYSFNYSEGDFQISAFSFSSAALVPSFFLLNI